jgi:hypothetical protein
VTRFVRDNGLSLFFLATFLAALAGQSIAGLADFNQLQTSHGSDPIGWWRYVTSSEFGVDVLENWQSEYLQFTLYILATIWLLQRGSSESKPPGEQGGAGDPHAAGLGLRLYSHSLVIVMTVIWVLSWFGQSIAGRVVYNAEQLDHREDPIGWVAYLGTSDFWSRTLQNWQSEFLAVGSMAVFAIYLRQRGSPESKPVGAPDEETGSES